tara:strand:+ start:1484 stop:3067 length:1584 start_codon:yes stop_codon:yes gene_type:complete
LAIIKKNFNLILSVLIIGIVITMPIFFILKESINVAYKDFSLFASFKLFDYFKQTIILIILTSIFSLIFAVFPAYIISFYKLRFKRLFDILLILPLAIPCYIMAFTYSDLLGFNGLIQSTFNQINFDVLTIGWLSFFLALALYPYVYTTTRISFSLVGSTYMDLSKSLGLTRFSTFTKVLLPLSLSGIFSGVILIVMEVLNEYGAVNYFGINTFSVGIFKYWFSLDNKSYAIVLSFLLLLLVLFFVYLSSLLKKSDDKLKYHIKSGKDSILTFQSKLSKNFSLTIISIPFFLGFVIPLVFVFSNVIDNFFKYDFNHLIELVKNSLYVGFIASFLIVVIAFYILNVKRVASNKLINSIIRVLTTGYAIPGAVVGLSLMLLLRLMGDNYTFLLGTIFLLVYAYIFRFMSVAIFPIETSLKRQPKTFDDQAKSLKLNSMKLFYKITIPLNKYALFSAFILVFIDILKELPVTLILRPFNFETLATQTYEYATEEMLAYSSLYSLTLIICCSFMLIYVSSVLNKKNVFTSR